MDHIDYIERYLKMLQMADDFHSFIIESPPGWGKSTSIMNSLEKLKIKFHAMGSYSTPLSLYRTLQMHADKVVVLDDCSGILNSESAMAVLSAATWPSVSDKKKRLVTWESSKIGDEELQRFEFKGKIIMITNNLPNAEAVGKLKSRSFYYKLTFTKKDIIEMLKSSASNKEFFKDQKTTQMVVKFLIQKLETHNYQEFNLRTLKKGCLFATVDPKNWKEPLTNLLPEIRPEEYVKQLAESQQPVKKQMQEFIERTGMSRRSFFSFRDQLNLSNPVMQAGVRKGKRK